MADSRSAPDGGEPLGEAVGIEDAYFLQGSIALLLGALATASGLQLALEIGVAVVALLSIAAGALAVTVGRQRMLATA